jgi:hypothetical protein
MNALYYPLAILIVGGLPFAIVFAWCKWVKPYA